MIPNNNLRVHNVHTLGHPTPILPCPVAGCFRRFYNRSGRSSHIQSQHPEFLQDAEEPQVLPLAHDISPPNTPSPTTLYRSTSSDSPAPGQTCSPDRELDEDRDEASDDDINMMFEPMWTPSLDYEGDNDGFTESQLAGSSSRGASPSDAPLGINRLYHSQIDG